MHVNNLLPMDPCSQHKTKTEALMLALGKSLCVHVAMSPLISLGV